MSLLVLGTVALDNIKTPAGVKKDLLGGSAAHFAMSARLFTDVHLAAIIGRDFPKRHIQFLRNKGIDLTSLQTGDGKSFRWEGEYKKEDLNSALTLATELGVLTGFQPAVAAHQRSIQNVFLANIDPDIQGSLLKAMSNPGLVGLDSMNLWITHKLASLKALMKKVNLFVANDGEARAISGQTNLIQAARSLRKLGPELIVVKKGEHGVLFYCDNFMFSFPAYPVDRVVDPTGAGDTFAGGFMGYLANVGDAGFETIKQAIVMGTVMASFNVEDFSINRIRKLGYEEIRDRYAAFKGCMQFSDCTL